MSIQDECFVAMQHYKRYTHIKREGVKDKNNMRFHSSLHSVQSHVHITRRNLFRKLSMKMTG